MNGCDVMPQEARIQEIDELNAEAWEIRSKDLATAREWAQQALDLARDAGYAKGEADSLSVLGYCDIAAGNFPDALSQALHALDTYNALEDARGQAYSAHLVSQSHLQLNDHPRALEHALPYLDIAQFIDDSRYYMGLLTTLGGAYVDRGDYDAAIRCAYDILDHSDEETSPSWYADALNNIAYTYYLQGDAQTGLAYSNRAIDTLERWGWPTRSLHCLHTAGVIRMELGWLNEARTFLERGLRWAQNEEIPISVIEFHVELGRLDKRNDDPNTALEHLHEALRDAQQLGSPLQQANVHHRLAQVYKANGDPEQALYHYEAFHRFDKQVFNEQSDQRVRALQIQHEVEQAQKQIESYRLENVSLHEEMEHRKVTEQELRKLAAQDPLTGVYNRQHVERQAGEILKDAGQADETVGMILIDLDGFKAVNDSYGHLIGDTVLRELTKRVQELIRANDILGRYGGDEFVVVLRDTSPEQCEAVAERIRRSIDERTLAPRQDISTTVSIGIVHRPAEAAMEASTLLQRADDALYAAKQAGKNRIRFWDESIKSMASNDD